MTTDAAQRLSWICEVTGAREARVAERIQSLWSGYGEIQRIRLTGAAGPSVVLKWIAPPDAANHPRGWNTDRSHDRKLRSYEVERAFYSDWAPRCPASARVPTCLGITTQGTCTLILLEDLDASGFDRRTMDPSDQDIHAGLTWLAGLHAAFLGESPRGLWETGTYWHLATRPDELAHISDPRLRAAAPALDNRLNTARYRTIVHGDAKIANFCLATDGAGIAAVDFQYCGGGCGIKDVAYFLSSCMTEVECEAHAADCLDVYFAALRHELAEPAVSDAVEAEWRALYPIAWADFYRFLAGWSPGHWKIHGYSDRITQQVLDAMD